MDSVNFQINHKNKALKRQSKMLLDKMGGLNITELKIEEEETESSPEETDYYKKLDKQIQGKDITHVF